MARRVAPKLARIRPVTRQSSGHWAQFSAETTGNDPPRLSAGPRQRAVRTGRDRVISSHARGSDRKSCVTAFGATRSHRCAPLLAGRGIARKCGQSASSHISRTLTPLGTPLLFPSPPSHPIRRGGPGNRGGGSAQRNCLVPTSILMQLLEYPIAHACTDVIQGPHNPYNHCVTI